MATLVAKKLSKHFGGLSAVSMVDLHIGHGELVGLIGPNGAGKTTLFNLLTGVYEPSEGEILFTSGGETTAIDGKSPERINQLGIARTFQNIRLFEELTVLENITIAMHFKMGASILASVLRTSAYYEKEQQMEARALELLSIFGMEHKAQMLAKNLPYGDQRCLEIVRALATEPEILFLDEPAAGMNPQETVALTGQIAQIQRDFGITTVLIEHDMGLVMDICERIYVLEYGRLIAQGTPAEIKGNPAVIKAYLGEDATC